MKTPTKKIVKKPAVKKAVINTQPIAKYTAVMRMGSLEKTAQGDTELILSKLNIEKVTNKCLLTVTNNLNKKSFECVYPPFMAKKVLGNDFVQKFQWKRITGKLL